MDGVVGGTRFGWRRTNVLLVVVIHDVDVHIL